MLADGDGGDGGDPSWFAVWNLRGDGSCYCPSGADCDRAGKHPFYLPWSGEGYRRGHRDAQERSGAEALIAEHSSARLARACGVGGMGAVLDADGDSGVADLLRVWPVLPWPQITRVSTTPRGLHVHLPGRGWSSSAGQRALRAAGLRHLEFKGRGSYVVWPDGLERRWLSPAQMRTWRIRAERRWAGALEWIRRADLERSGVGWPWLEDWVGPVDTDEDGEFDGGSGVEQDPVGRLRRACWAVMRGDEGQRNNLLNWAGFTAGRAALRAGADRDWVVGVLSEAGRAAGLERGETERTVRSGLGLNGE